MPNVVVFDIGGVLIDWRPHLAWMDDLGSRAAVEAFMARVDFMSRNARADAGESFSDLADEIEDQDDRRRLAAYVSLYTRTVPEKLPGTWEIVESLRAAGVPLHGITNWSSETWPEGIKVHPELDEIFQTLIVSGREGIAKPDSAIFQLLCDRAGVLPANCVFIDDGLHNVDAARGVGMDGIHFTGADRLADALRERGLL